MKRNSIHTPPSSVDILEYIQQEKVRTLHEVRASSARIKEKVNTLFASPKITTNGERLLYAAEQGMALYNGIRMGMTVIRALRGLFHKKDK